MTHLTKTEFHRMAVVDYAHGISHTRPILARGVHFNAANEPFAAMVARNRIEQAEMELARLRQMRVEHEKGQQCE